MQDKKQDLSWYKKLKLSQKYKLNAGIGMLMISIGAIILAITGEEMLYHWQSGLHASLSILLLLVGLWFFGTGVRYQSQLDAIRIARRNRGGFRKNNDKKGKPTGKKA
ncbi:MAG: hypothetical protein NXI00_19235 [Cytophagales bacterium]|nr:hypothetical protein [Cytophagales bacterium]